MLEKIIPHLFKLAFPPHIQSDKRRGISWQCHWLHHHHSMSSNLLYDCNHHTVDFPVQIGIHIINLTRVTALYCHGILPKKKPQAVWWTPCGSSQACFVYSPGAHTSVSSPFSLQLVSFHRFELVFQVLYKIMISWISRGLFAPSFAIRQAKWSFQPWYWPTILWHRTR